MKTGRKRCLDCGSEMVGETVEKSGALIRKSVANFACGALLESSFDANCNVGRLMHWGCPVEVETPGNRG